MSASQQIRADDLRAMLRLAGEAGELPPASEARHRHLLEGLCRLVGGNGSLMFIMGRDPINGPLMDDGPFLTTGLTPEQNEAFYQHVTTPRPRPMNPIAPLVIQANRHKPVVTQHRRQV